MTHKTKTPLALAIGTAFAASLAASGIANAAPNSSNPFAMSDMSSGYMQVADAKEGKCGEGKCGGAKSSKEGKCGEGKCGGAKSTKEGKCGEGKCGGQK